VLASKDRFSPETEIPLINFSGAVLDTAAARPDAGSHRLDLNNSRSIDVVQGSLYPQMSQISADGIQ
jgi:hypothetical protein